jgi:hypothetical protein
VYSSSQIRVLRCTAPLHTVANCEKRDRNDRSGSGVHQRASIWASITLCVNRTRTSRGGGWGDSVWALYTLYPAEASASAQVRFALVLCRPSIGLSPASATHSCTNQCCRLLRPLYGSSVAMDSHAPTAMHYTQHSMAALSHRRFVDGGEYSGFEKLSAAHPDVAHLQVQVQVQSNSRVCG